MYRMAAAAAGNRIATASSLSKTSGPTSSLLAALDALDLNATEITEQSVHLAARTGLETAGRVDKPEQGGSVERLKPESVEVPIHPFFQKSSAPGKALKPPMSAMRVGTASKKTESKTSKCKGKASAQKKPKIIRLEDMMEESRKENLPLYSYKDYTSPKPYIVYTRHEEETNDLVDSLKRGTVAMDLEWRVTYFKKHETNSVVQNERKTAVVQIADGAGLILIVQVNGMRRFPARLQALIEDRNIAKVGVNILNDGKKLFRDYGIIARNLVELGSVALAIDPLPVANRKIVSLAKLVEHYCGKLLTKGPERTSDWEMPLNVVQQEYAANDAHSSLLVYNKLLKIGETHSCALADVSSQYTSEVTWSMGSDNMSTLQLTSQLSEGMRPQYLRAYEYWHWKELPLDEMCVKLSLKSKGYYGPVQQGENVALKPGTIISYVMAALQNDPRLEYQMDRLVKLVQTDLHSWSRHGAWIIQQLCQK